MAAEPALESTLTNEEEDEELIYDEESDVYEDGEKEGEDVDYDSDEDEDEDAEEDLGQGEPKNMTALLLGKQNGTTETEVYDEDDEDDEYQEDAEGIDDNQTDLSSSVVGSKRGVDELAEEDANGDEDDDEAVVTKKARV